MATLIWSKVRNIRIGDTNVPFEVKYDDGSSLDSWLMTNHGPDPGDDTIPEKLSAVIDYYGESEVPFNAPTYEVPGPYVTYDASGYLFGIVPYHYQLYNQHLDIFLHMLDLFSIHINFHHHIY